MDERVGVIGLGYVGLPVALGFARHYDGTVGFDISPERVASLRAGDDRTGEVDAATLDGSTLKLTSEEADLEDRTFFIVAVPTPVDAGKRPDLRALTGASETIGRVIRPGAVIVFESTVYPGVTEEVCGPTIARVSGLRVGADFTLAYSPERINPGDREHTLERITKIVAGQDEATLQRVARAYERVIEAGIHRAPSIMVAEAAKVLENTQRDLNVALMNELALICDRVGIRTSDVLEAARTKWNFLPFKPGLVGGHCIGVDPYYLTARAEQLGYRPEVILAGRRVNDRIGEFVATKTIKLLIEQQARVHDARVGVLGLTFKEDVTDLRNSRVPDIVETLEDFGIRPLVHDPMASAADVEHELGFRIDRLEDLDGLDALILAVPHRAYLQDGSEHLLRRLKPGGILVDVKSALPVPAAGSDVRYWSL